MKENNINININGWDVIISYNNITNKTLQYSLFTIKEYIYYAEKCLNKYFINADLHNINTEHIIEMFESNGINGRINNDNKICLYYNRYINLLSSKTFISIIRNKKIKKLLK